MTYAVLAILSDGCPPLKGRLPTCYSPVRRFTRQPKPPFSLDLHVLSPPLTFALSQDQTLHLILITFLHRVSLSGVSMTGFFSWFRLGFSAIQFSETEAPPDLPHPDHRRDPQNVSRRRDRAYTACFRSRQRSFSFFQRPSPSGPCPISEARPT